VNGPSALAAKRIHPADPPGTADKPGETFFSHEEAAAPATRSAPGVETSAEWDLLLAGSSPDPVRHAPQRLRSILQRSPQWDCFLRLADHHGTSSLLYQNLLRVGDGLPTSVLATLRRRYEANIHKSLYLTRELIRILDCLAPLAITVIPYKGVVLSENLYGDMALRQSGDIDLFVRARDVARVKSVVHDLAYTPRLAIPAALDAAYLASGYECTFDSPAGCNLLELQWSLQPHFYAVNFDMDGLFQRAVAASVSGHPVPTPSPEDLLLVLSVHAAKHVWGRILWLCDVAQLLKRQNLNWPWIVARAKECGIERILRLTLLLTKRLLGAPLPAAMDNAILADRAVLAFADEIGVSIARGVSYEQDQWSYFHLMMRLRERWTDRIRFLTRLTFTPGPGEWHALRLPAPLFPLYRAVRLARLAARFARG
jgi:hypothetical protein